jgi:hypothetical protein
LTGIRGEGFDIPPLPFGKNCIERQGGFPGTGESGYDDKFIARDFNSDILEVMFPRTNNAYDIMRHRITFEC